MAGSSSAASRRREPELRTFRRLIRIVSPVFSPGGRRILFVSVRTDIAHNRYDETLWVESIAGGRPRALVRGMRELSEPRWSPDGKTVSFLAEVHASKPEIYAVSSTGGTPRRLSRAPQGVEQYAWSPGGRRIAYVSPDPPRFTARERWSGHDLFTVHDDSYLVEAPPEPSEIWILSLPSFAVRQLTHGPTGVLEGAPPFNGSISVPSWSPHGHWIVYTRVRDAAAGDTEDTEIAAVSSTDGRIRLLGGHKTYEYDPYVDPRADLVSYLYPQGPGPISDMDIMVVGLKGGRPRDVSENLDRDVATTYAWLPDGAGFVALANDGVGSRLYLQPLHGPAHPLRLGSLEPLDLAVSSRGAIAFVADGAARPPELYVLPSPGKRPIELTHFNHTLRSWRWPKSVAVHWRAPDGVENDGILTYPLNDRKGVRSPLVVFIHGGPEAASNEHFDAGEIGPLRDVFAAQGFLVFEPNYEGSDNLGNAYEHRIYLDPARGPAEDILSGIRTLERRGLVRPDDVAIVGHSYGGYLTAWLDTQVHTWRCAVIADGVTDWRQEYTLSGSGNLAWTQASLGGGPWNPRSRRRYRSDSPITYAQDVSTPTLLISGTSDVTVPITESFAFYHALVERHVPVRFVAIPGAYHLPQDPVQLELFYRTIDRWVVRYLRNER